MTTVTRLKQKAPTEVVKASGRLTPVSLEGARSAISSDVVLITDPAGARAEAIRALRTHIIAQHVHGGRRALAICAPGAGVGCTFLAVNLAVALSQAGVKTMLIDADMRHPGVDNFIAPSNPGLGLQQYLASSEVSFAEAVEADVLSNLSVLHSGGVASNPQELLAGERFQELADVCLRDFEATIVDTPPASTCADARRISNVIGYSLVVARRDKTFVNDVKTLVSQLRDDHARVVGTVLNDA